LTACDDLASVSEGPYNYVAQFMLHTMVPSGRRFIKDDLWGGIGAQ